MKTRLEVQLMRVAGYTRGKRNICFVVLVDLPLNCEALTRDVL